MREGWKLKEVIDVCLVTDYVANGSFKSLSDNVTYNYEKDYALLLRTTDFTKNFKKSFVYVNEDSYKFLKKSSVYPNDIVICNVGSVGLTFLVPDLKVPMTIGPNSILIRPLIKMELDNKYFYFLFKSPFGQDLIKSITSGTTQSKFNKTNFRQLGIPIPPFQEQKQIVEILVEAFKGIDQAKANIEKNIRNTNELFQSKLNDVFSHQGEGWEEKTLKEIAKDFGRGKSKNRPRNDPKLFGGKYPFIQTGDVRNTGKILKTYLQTYNEVGLAQSKLWPKGTICITIAANIAETAILDFDSCFPDSIIGLVVDSKLADTDYTYYSLQFLKGKLQELGKGSAQDNINLGTFQNQYFPFPNVIRQKEIVLILDKISSQTNQVTSKYQQKLIELEELKKSILQKAFIGELTSKSVEV